MLADGIQIALVARSGMNRGIGAARPLRARVSESRSVEARVGGGSGETAESGIRKTGGACFDHGGTKKNERMKEIKS